MDPHADAEKLLPWRTLMTSKEAVANKAIF